MKNMCKIQRAERALEALSRLWPPPLLGEAIMVDDVSSTPEEWRPIPGFDNYKINAFGEIYTLRRKGVAGGQLAHTLDTRGYRVARIFKGNREYRIRVHKLVMLAFAGPRPSGTEIRHVDGNKENPAFVNLRYGTRSDNVNDSVVHGVHHYAGKTHCPQGHIYDEANTYFPPQANVTGTNRQCRACRAARGRKMNARKRTLRKAIDRTAR
jgi:hypothetical protein